TDPYGLSPNCKHAPTPALPGRGDASWAQKPPEKAPAPIDPKDPKAPAHIYEQYGFAGLEWHTYDLSCSGTSGLAEAAGASMGTTWANLLFSGSKWWTGVAVALQQEATGDGYMSGINDVFAKATRAVTDAVYRPWIGISLLLLGVVIVYRAGRKDWPDTAKSVAWALLVMTVTAIAFNYPEKAGSLADEMITQTVGQVQQGVAGDTSKGADPATSQGNVLTGTILYNNWLRGEFGSSDAPVAKKYGMQLYDAQALTWAQSRLPQKERDTLIVDKKKTWENVAEKVKKEDPDAYRHLTGVADGRFGASASGALGAIPTNFFSFAASIVIICARLILKLVIVFLPAIAPIALHRQMSGTLRTLARSGGAALINAPLFVLAASLEALFIQVLLSGGNRMPEWFAVVLLWVLTVMLWAITKPFRKLSAMISPNAEWFGRGTGAMGRTKTALGGAILGYARGRITARQIGKMVNGGRGGRVEDADEAAGAGPAVTTRHQTRRSEDEPWADAVPYEPDPGQDRAPEQPLHWGPGRQWDDLDSWPAGQQEPAMAAAAAVPDQAGSPGWLVPVGSTAAPAARAATGTLVRTAPQNDSPG
ncbi:hypothetical protein, partial [Streptomyces albireticuli]